jgi:hypothetical protein
MSAEIIEVLMPDDAYVQDGIELAEEHGSQQPRTDREFEGIVAADATPTEVEGGRMFNAPVLRTLQGIVEAKLRRRKAGLGAGILTVRQPDFQFQNPDFIIHRS